MRYRTPELRWRHTCNLYRNTRLGQNRGKKGLSRANACSRDDARARDAGGCAHALTRPRACTD
eukprot:11157635-Lingulodinium_polyedra.AAC.1